MTKFVCGICLMAIIFADDVYIMVCLTENKPLLKHDLIYWIYLIAAHIKLLHFVLIKELLRPVCSNSN